MPGRLICYTAAACIDRYLRVPELRVGHINRPRTVTAQPGGKGINVARTARALGANVNVVGHASAGVSDAFNACGIPAVWSASAHTRQCLVVLDESSGELTEFYEPVPPESAVSWRPALEVFRRAVAEAAANDIVTVSGRLPEGWPLHALSELVACARSAEVAVWLDTDDCGLAAGLEVEPDLVKINHHEAAEFIGTEIDDLDSAVAAADKVRSYGARAVIITIGEHGCVHVDEYGNVRHQPAPPLRFAHAVGSGDAFLAGLAAATLRGMSSREAVRFATATASAAARQLVAGDLDGHDVESIRAEVASPTVIRGA